jgi:redox-sensitive bicupin YhaK (pirin superfamily)
VWLTFDRQPPLGLVGEHFGALRTFDEIRLPPGGGSMPRARDDAEVVTYMYRGALAQRDSTGRSDVLCAGEFQRMCTAGGISSSETNASRTNWAHVFRISLRTAKADLDVGRTQKRFAAGQRHNLLCVVASPDGRKGSLGIVQDALVCSSVLDSGHHLIHELLPGRSAWLHVLLGQVAVQELVLTRGDAVGVTLEPAIAFTAQESSEVLLVDLGQTPRSIVEQV